MNLFADMGVQPTSLQEGLVAATASSDNSPPASKIEFPVDNRFCPESLWSLRDAADEGEAGCCGGSLGRQRGQMAPGDRAGDLVFEWLPGQAAPSPF
ncbi:MAG: hypothetical protein Ct9H300mP16_10700 [Pseudomonadota bacterium]|nr:MAG: hypothetical protein Ct9H300mP16_10700 [Pseudomonadota bacterium]